MFPESHGLVPMPATSCIKDTSSNLSLNNYSEGDEIVRPCDRHSNETAIFRKHVTKYKNIQKWMVEFLGKFENRGVKIARITFILINKSINILLFTFIFYCVGVRCDVDIFTLTASYQSI